MKPNIRTLGELKQSGHKIESVKDEMRRNLLHKLRQRETLFPGIIGFEDSVIPQLVNAILARHDILLLGLRGQAKTRLARQMITLLDEYTPIIKGSELNDHPLQPISHFAVQSLAEHGEATPIEWVHRSERYGEKLATPDVTIADLIGDIDPIKAATQRLHYSHEGAIHFGIIPRTNRGIFVINELPDLQPRIQVGLFNILQERDIQIRGFNVRIPLDVCIIFTANPEDYTRRGTLITPLKDRIDSQIITHYPRTLEHGMAITNQEAWTKREESGQVYIPHFVHQIVESIAFIARTSEFVDQSSGVSARLTISTMEAMVSNAERRSALNGGQDMDIRIIDIAQACTGITGKVELVFEGEQEGPLKMARALTGKAIREVFKLHFPDPLEKTRRRDDPKQKPAAEAYTPIIRWFEQGNTIALNDTMPIEEYQAQLERVPGLHALVEKYMKDLKNQSEILCAMEFVLEALHHNSKIAKDDDTISITYKDMVGSIFSRQSARDMEDDDA
jgi:magnesium chelatase subunit I